MFSCVIRVGNSTVTYHASFIVLSMLSCVTVCYQGWQQHSYIPCLLNRVGCKPVNYIIICKQQDVTNMTPSEKRKTKRVHQVTQSRPHRRRCIRTKDKEECPQKICQIDKVTVGDLVDMVVCEKRGQWFHCYCVNYTDEVNFLCPTCIYALLVFS